MRAAMRLLLAGSFAVAGSFAAAAAVVVNATCIGNGQNDTAISNALAAGGAGTTVELCPGAVIPFYEGVLFTAENQTVQTQGRPTGSLRATLRATVNPNNFTTSLMFQMYSPTTYGPFGQGYNNVGLRNLILDANNDIPPSNFAPPTPGNHGLVSMGFGANGQFVDHVDIVNSQISGSAIRIWADGSYFPDANTTITNCVFRNCSIGILTGGTNTTVAYNQFYIENGAGVVQFNAGGDQGLITKNLFAATGQTGGAFAGIILTQSFAYYEPTLTATTISDNQFVASEYMSAGIMAGSVLYGAQLGLKLTGPLTITNNDFSGRIAFPIAIDKVDGHVTATQNTFLGLASPVSSFTNTSTCHPSLKAIAAQNYRLIQGKLNQSYVLQPGFYNATNDNLRSFYCLSYKDSPPLKKSYIPPRLSAKGGERPAARGGNIGLDF